VRALARGWCPEIRHLDSLEQARKFLFPLRHDLSHGRLQTRHEQRREQLAQATQPGECLRCVAVIPQAILQALDGLDRGARIEPEHRHQRLAGIARMFGSQPKLVQCRRVGAARGLPAAQETLPALGEATGDLLAQVSAAGDQPRVPQGRLQTLEALEIRHGSRVFPELEPRQPAIAL